MGLAIAQEVTALNSENGGPVSIPSQSMWNSWWTKWFFLVSMYHFTNAFCVFIYHRRCLVLATAVSLNNVLALNLSNATKGNFRRIMSDLKDIHVISTIHVMSAILFLYV
jgi:hypothetical protein